MEQEFLLQQQILEQNKHTEEVSNIVERLDFLDIQILRKFYATGKEFPLDTQPFCFPILYQEMKQAHHLKIGLEGLRKRLNVLVACGFLEKVKNSNPANYAPIRGKETTIRSVIMRFFIVHVVTKFL